MSCGLGAVILMFLLVKKNSNNELNEKVQNQPSSEIELLKTEAATLTAKSNNLKAIKESMLLKETELKIRIEDYVNILNTQREKEKNNINKVNQLEKNIKKITLTKVTDKITLDGKAQQEYLIGLEIKGNNILILLDSSASMTDEKLIDIIKRKTQARKNILQGPKWQRTLRIVKWLLSRLPDNSKVSIIKFSDTSEIIGQNIWYKNNSKSLSKLFSEVNKIVPSDATNLHLALKSIEEMAIKPDEIFIITDGLPTKGSSKLSNQDFFSKCNSIIANAKKISGDCRERLFQSSINTFSSITKTLSCSSHTNSFRHLVIFIF